MSKWNKIKKKLKKLDKEATTQNKTQQVRNGHHPDHLQFK